jgi:putative DNA primase/helicase
MAFCGMRRIVSQEGKPNAPIREDFVRSLAEKKMTGRWVFSNPVTFTRTFKLTHVTNHMPRITAVDDAIRRRVIKVEWGHKVEHPDRDLFDKLKEELPGILAWMLRGFLDWQEHGFVIPGFMADDTDAYLRDENPVAQFLSECCDLNNVEGKVRAKELHQSYTLWSETNGFMPLGNINFAKAIRLNVPTTVKKGTTDFGKGGKAEGWTGITLLPDAPRPRFS